MKKLTTILALVTCSLLSVGLPYFGIAKPKTKEKIAINNKKTTLKDNGKNNSKKKDTLKSKTKPAKKPDDDIFKSVLDSHKKTAKVGSKTLSIWKKRKKQITPIQLKEIIEENHRLKTLDGRFNNEADNASLGHDESLTANKETDTGGSNKKISATLSQSVSTGDQVSQDLGYTGSLAPKDSGKNANGEYFIKGIIFKVQIGAYRKRNLSKILEESPQQEAFEQEKDNEINHYTIRHFRNYWKAEAFKKELREMGVSSTWIVVFKDGKRVDLKSVMDLVKKQVHK